MVSGIAFVSSSAALSSMIADTRPSADRTMRPRPSGCTRVEVSIVMQASVLTWRSINRRRVSRKISGTSPQRTSTLSTPARAFFALRRASPLPNGSGCRAYSTVSPRASLNAWEFSGTTVATLSTPAPLAASTTSLTISLPQTWCKTLGTWEFMRVPLPAAKTTAANLAMA